MRFLVTSWTTEHIPMIDEDRTKVTLGISEENCLPVVRMFCTNIQQPCEPEITSVLDSFVAASGKDLEQIEVLSSEVAGAKAEVSRTEVLFERFDFISWVLIEKCAGEE